MNRATEINSLHETFREGLRTTVQTAIRIGELLTAQKKDCEHGAWTSWIKTNLKFSERAAQKYMACYSNRDRLTNTPADELLTINELAKAPPRADLPPKIFSGYQTTLNDYKAFVAEHAPERVSELTDEDSICRVRKEVLQEVRWTKLTSKAETISHWLGKEIAEQVKSGEMSEDVAYNMALGKVHDSRLSSITREKHERESDDLKKLTYSIHRIFHRNGALTIKLEKAIEQGPHTHNIYELKDLVQALKSLANEATNFAQRLSNPERKPKQATVITIDGAVTTKQLPYHHE